jgi:hypothetical protein
LFLGEVGVRGAGGEVEGCGDATPPTRCLERLQQVDVDAPSPPAALTKPHTLRRNKAEDRLYIPEFSHSQLESLQFSNPMESEDLEAFFCRNI